MELEIREFIILLILWVSTGLISWLAYGLLIKYSDKDEAICGLILSIVFCPITITLILVHYVNKFIDAYLIKKSDDKDIKGIR